MIELSRLENAVHHISLITKAGREQVADFYGGMMGLSLVNEVEIKQNRLLYYRITSNLLLEIILTSDIPETDTNTDEGGGSGFAHFAFTVDDVGLWYGRITEAGLEVTYGPEIIKELKINTFLFRDPFGAVWEMMEETE